MSQPKPTVQPACKPQEMPPQHRMMTMPRERGPVHASDILGPLVKNLAEKSKTK